jgi:hypothetical protein
MRNGLLVGFGAVIAVASFSELSGTALAENSELPMTISNEIETLGYMVQPDWWYCVNCYGLYHSDNDTAGGVCPAGGSHQNNTSYTNYCIPHSGDTLPEDGVGAGVQVGWRWCVNCQGLFWGSAAAESVCPAGGEHVVTSTAYVYDLPYGVPPDDVTNVGWSDEQVFQQANWLYCSKCRGLFYGHGGSTGGVCPAGGSHLQYGSTNYQMIDYP